MKAARTYRKPLVLIVGLVSLLGSCTEVYVPDVDNSEKTLVVEGLLTDGSGPFTVKLTSAIPFDSTGTPSAVTNALVRLNDDAGGSWTFTHRIAGSYYLPNTFRATIGRTYQLNIKTSDGNIYETDPQELLPASTPDSFEGNLVFKPFLDENNTMWQVEGFDIRANLFGGLSDTTPRPLVRFRSQVVLQYYYSFYELVPPETRWFWYVFGWNTYSLDESENLTDASSEGQTPDISGHPVCFVPKKTSGYGISTNVPAVTTHYLKINCYTINEATRRFYEVSNQQIEDKNKLFNPVPSQLIGNVHCLSDESKVALGFFEVSSVKQLAFVLKPYGQTVEFKPVPYVSFPEKGGAKYKVWASSGTQPKDDPSFTVVAHPWWWTHPD